MQQGRSRRRVVARRNSCVAFLAMAAMIAVPAASAAEPALGATWGHGSHSFAIATGTPGETGLLERLATEFADLNDAKVSWYPAGSGQALALLKQGKVDMVLAHSPKAEEKAVAEGWATGRALIGSNEFWIVGPKSDPAKVVAATNAADALRRISATRSKFVSRGDESGTHQRELALWKSAGLEPAGDWYIVTGDFMAASLRRADAERAYFLTDSSTFILQRSELPNLKVLFRGGKDLSNPYHTLYRTQSTPGTQTARRFGEFLLSERGQEIMRKYGRGRYGEPLYFDAATTAR